MRLGHGIRLKDATFEEVVQLLRAWSGVGRAFLHTAEQKTYLPFVRSYPESSEERRMCELERENSRP